MNSSRDFVFHVQDGDLVVQVLSERPEFNTKVPSAIMSKYLQPTLLHRVCQPYQVIEQLPIHTWPSSLLLADFLLREHELVADKVVLEVCCMNTA